MKLVIKDLEFKFKSKTLKLPDICETFDDMLVLKGHIGSGKTMLLKALAGIAEYSGLISLDKNGSAQSGYFVHSQPEFNFVTGNIQDELSFAGIPTNGFESYLDKNINNLSGGELKKISLHMALKASEGIIFLDEPLDMMDDVQCEETARYIADECKGKPVIITTHDSYFDKYAKTIRIDSNYNCQEPCFTKNEIFGETVFRADAINVVNVEKTLPTITLTLREKEIICVYGLNGSGKTLFIKTIAGISRLEYTGSFKWLKTPGVCLQFPEQMVYRGTIREEIGDLVQSDMEIDNILKVLGWEKRATESPFSLSDGEKRLMYIISILESRQCCVFDEPFAGLDPSTVFFIVERFADARDKGKSILYTANRLKDTAYADTLVNI